MQLWQAGLKILVTISRSNPNEAEHNYDCRLWGVREVLTAAFRAEVNVIAKFTKCAIKVPKSHFPSVSQLVKKSSCLALRRPLPSFLSLPAWYSPDWKPLPGQHTHSVGCFYCGHFHGEKRLELTTQTHLLLVNSALHLAAAIQNFTFEYSFPRVEHKLLIYTFTNSGTIKTHLPSRNWGSNFKITSIMKNNW